LAFGDIGLIGNLVQVNVATSEFRSGLRLHLLNWLRQKQKTRK
jgi:predicted DNA-binding ribbon-helix-helix protein